jgi:hypothetical protein
LKSTGLYEFRIVGELSTFIVKVDVKSLPTRDIESEITVEEGYDVTMYVGYIDITSITVNGEVLEENQYSHTGTYLTISKDALERGENEIVINGSTTVKVTVNAISDTVITTTKDNTLLMVIVIASIVGGVLLSSIAVVTTILIMKKHKAKKE